MIDYLFYTLFFSLPLIFYTKTSEVFEFNKMVTVYIFTTLIVAVWIIKMIREGKIIFRRTILDVPILLYLGSQLISTLISIDVRTSIFGYYSRFNGGLLSLISFSLLYWAYVSNVDKKKTINSIRLLLVSAAIVSVYGILEHFGGSISCIFVTGKFNDSCWVQDVQSRVFATLGQPNWLAAFLASLLPITWYFALKEKTKKAKLIWIGVSAIFFACFLFTKSRSGLLGLAAAFLIYWFLNLYNSKGRSINFSKIKIAAIFSLIFLFFVLTFGTAITPSIKDLFNHSTKTQTVDTSEGGTESGAIREIVWEGARDIFNHYPIFGTGVETFGYSYWQFRPIAHNNTSEWDYLYNKAHNEYLNFAANSGSIGLISYLIFIGVCLVVLRKRPELLAGFVSILITNFFGFSVVVISLLTFLMPAMAITLETEREKMNLKYNVTARGKILSGGIILAASFILILIGRYWYADHMYNKGQLELSAGEYSNSVSDVQTAINYSPSEAIYHNQMTRIFVDVAIGLNNNNEATNAAKLIPYAQSESDIAFSLSPRNMNIRETRITTYLELAQFDHSYYQTAINFITDTIPLSPTDPKLHLILGKTYANIGKLDLAKEELLKALQLKPDYSDAKAALAVVEKLKKK